MRLTTKGRYGVRAMLNLAASYHNRPISINQIAQEEEISPEFLEQIFFKLKKAGIIRSLRGPGGGFVLAKKASEINIKSILDAVGESTHPTPCTEPGRKDVCHRSTHCPMLKPWSRFERVIDDFLSKLTLKDIMDEGGQKYHETLRAGQDFAI